MGGEETSSLQQVLCPGCYPKEEAHSEGGPWGKQPQDTVRQGGMWGRKDARALESGDCWEVSQPSGGFEV